jgi:plastocyanin
MSALLMIVLVPASGADTSRFRASGDCRENPHWDPTVRRISKGDRIVWKNPTSCDHTVNAYGGGWSKSTVLSPGESTRKRFRSAGTFKFRCMTPGHSALDGGVCQGMCGKVRVRR